MFTDMSGKRPYRMSDRARSQEQTRRRIVEATMWLHETVGPRNTTISAIAERAGVQRLTVYRHFPDEAAVFLACTAHWLTLNPTPHPAVWEEIADPEARLSAALDAFYGYYARTARMWAASYRDVDEVPALQGPMAEVGRFMRAIGDALAVRLGSPPPHDDAVGATIHHGLAFSTWADLDALGFDTARKVSLVLGWVRGCVAPGYGRAASTSETR
jgi:AcrR family transcriptional regulator